MPNGGAGHLRCPYCQAYEVDRVYVATVRMDACECRACGARWDEQAETGAYRGRAGRSSAVAPPR